MEGECYDYDADIDELFVLAGKIISPAGQEEVCFILKLFTLICNLKEIQLLFTCYCVLYHVVLTCR